MEEAIPTSTAKEQAIATVLEVTKVIPGWFVTEDYLSRLYDENQCGGRYCGDKDAELRYRVNALGHCLVEKYNESQGYTRLDEGYLQAIDWDLSFREKWPVNFQNIPVFPRPTSGDEHLSPEAQTKRKVLEAAMIVGRIIPGWYLTHSYLQHVYGKYIEQRKTNNFEDDLKMMGVALKTEFLDRHRLYFAHRRLNDSIYQANAADRFIRRLDWVDGQVQLTLDENGNVMLVAADDEEAWEKVKQAHLSAFNWLGTQSFIARHRISQAAHRVALHVTKEGADNARPIRTYSPDNDREVEGWLHPPSSLLPPPKPKTPQDMVIDAALDVSRMFPGWKVTREFLEELYEAKYIDDIHGQEHRIEALGEQLKRAFLSRYVKHFYGTRLDQSFFRHAGGEDIVRLVSWVKSAQRGVLVDFAGHRL